jgi:Ca-activated chloride channel family protein
MRLFTFLIFFASVFSQSNAQVSTEASVPSPIIFIFDASGSMWGKIEEQYKISLAREMLGDLVDKLDPQRKIGLVAYGHRRKDDCNDIEWLMQPAANASLQFKEKLDALNPSGKTPLALSAEQVVDVLQREAWSATIILITDGLETCPGNLCDVVHKAKASGIDFVLHVIGFDLGTSDKSNLECAAREGDGIFLDAASGEDLHSALNQTATLTLENTNATLRIGSTKEGQRVDATVQVFPSGADKLIASMRTYKEARTNPTEFHLPAGVYDVSVIPVGLKGVLPARLENIHVVEDSVTAREVDFSAGMLSVKVTTNGKLHDASLTIIPSTKGVSVSSGRTYEHEKSNPQKTELSPDTYTVIVKSVTISGTGAEQEFTGVSVLAGQLTELKCEIPHGILTIGTKHGGELWDCTVNVVDIRTGKSVSAGRTYALPTHNPKKFMLSPGKYEVRISPIKLDKEAKKITVDIQPGQVNEQTVSF